jgi:glucose-6-phosphate isomerase
MFPHLNPTNTQAWKDLENHAGQMRQTTMRNLFAADADRASSIFRCAQPIWWWITAKT